jgi:uncharacterized damage-inducible protein DinB
MSVQDMRQSITGMSTDAINWKPAGEGTNSVAVLATHSMLSARSWISIAVGAPLPDRDRDAEFVTHSDSAEGLLAQIDALAAECENLLDDSRSVDWTAQRATHPRPDGRAQEAPAAWALLHAMEHLREHVGHIGLTRQLWDARNA